MKRVNFHVDANFIGDMGDHDDTYMFLGRVHLDSPLLEVLPLNVAFVQGVFLIPFFLGVIVGALAVTLL